LLNPLDEAPDMACRQPQHDARLDLREFLLHRLTNHMYPPELLHTHDHPVPSDHPALRLKASSLATKRTCLLWPKRTLSLWDYRISLGTNVLVAGAAVVRYQRSIVCSIRERSRSGAGNRSTSWIRLVSIPWMTRRMRRKSSSSMVGTSSTVELSMYGDRAVSEH
jgi:hypothetical protein